MAAFCLPPKLADKFTAALKDGTINPDTLADMSSAERRKFFEGVVGVENAEDVNALFESKLLLKDVKRGLVTWAQQVRGITEPARKDLLSKINRMPSEMLTPLDEKHFLADLVASRLGVTVTKEEAEQIAALSKTAKDTLAGRNASDPATWQAFGEAQLQLTEYVDSLKPGLSNWQKFGVEGVKAVARGGVIATADASAAAMLFARVTSPEWWGALFRLRKQMADPKFFRAQQALIRGDPDYDTLVGKMGIQFSDLRASTVHRMEEGAIPNFVEDFNEYIKRLVKRTTGAELPINIAAASQRAFVGSGNYVRYRAAKDLLAAARLAGLGDDLKVLSDLGDVVNVTTMRGRVGATPGGALEKLGLAKSEGGLFQKSLPALSAIFWTPRKQAALIRFFNPWYYVSPNISPIARKAQLRQLVGSMAALGATLSLAKLSGYDVEMDPRHTNFGRIVSGRVSFDPTQGGLAYLRFYARFITGQSISAADNLTNFGEGYKPTTRLTLAGDMLRGRLIPWAGNLASAMHGTDPAGRPFGVPEALGNTLIPMTMGSLIELATEEPDNIGALILSPLTLFGVGMQIQAEPKNTSRWDALGAPKGTDQSNNPVQRALENAGIELGMPERNIRSAPLDDRLYDEYAFRAGKAVQREIAVMLRTTPGFNKLAVGEQEKMLRLKIRKGREQARNDMIVLHQGIAREADRLKEQWAKQGTPAAQARRAAQ